MRKSRSAKSTVGSAANWLGACAMIVPVILFTSRSQALTYPWAETARHALRKTSVWDAQSGSLLIDYFRKFEEDRDVNAFRDRVSARYPESTLGLILADSPVTVARQAAVTALFVRGSYEGSNVALGRALADSDPVVRNLALDALWAIWCRADTPEHNLMLDQVSKLIASGELKLAESLVNRLITEAPDFVEAYNQRAIIYFHQGRIADSAAECQRVIKHNPFHIGAIGGLAQCQERLGQTRAQLETTRRASAIQPYNERLREQIKILESEIATMPSSLR